MQLYCAKGEEGPSNFKVYNRRYGPYPVCYPNRIPPIPPLVSPAPIVEPCRFCKRISLLCLPPDIVTSTWSKFRRVWNWQVWPEDREVWPEDRGALVLSIQRTASGRCPFGHSVRFELRRKQAFLKFRVNKKNWTLFPTNVFMYQFNMRYRGAALDCETQDTEFNNLGGSW